MDIDPERLIDAALTARDNGSIEEILPTLEAAARRLPDHFRIWQTLAGSFRAIGDSANAMEAYRHAQRASPTEVKAIHGLAQATLEAGLPASGLFAQALNLAPGNGDLILGMTAAQIADGNADSAVNYLATVVTANPLWLDGHQTLARLRWQWGGEEFFADSYLAAIATNPGHTPLWQAYIDILIHSQCYAHAADEIHRAKHATPENSIFDLPEAICASELGRMEEADMLFQRLLRRDTIYTAERHVRHLLRTARPEHALSRAWPWITRPGATILWPYISIAWRLLGDSRADWLDAPDRLIGIYDLDIASFGRGLAKVLRNIHNSGASPLGQSVVGGTQTDGPLFSRIEPEIRELKSAIRTSVLDYQNRMGATDPDHPILKHVQSRFDFTGSWSVRLQQGGFHSSHIHPLGWLSSAFYVDVPKGDELGSPPAGCLLLGEPPPEFNSGLSPYRIVEPKVGRLVLFPSIMWHGTQRFDAGERLSVAFDLKAYG